MASADALERILSDLRWLVATDSQNPPRQSNAIVERLSEALNDPNLGDFRVSVEDHGSGCVNVFAVRGEPKLLVNVHVDTVPVCPGWTRDPHTLHVEGSRAFGLGACDIKGGAAAVLEAVRQSHAPVALLFSTDEEAGQATCARAFVDAKRPFDLVVVAEPTRCRAVVAHRGVASAKIAFDGVAGHASAARAREDSANHALVAWAHAALRHADACETRGVQGAKGVRFNLGRIDGGEKSNMIAARAEARFGLRPPPGCDPTALAEEFFALSPSARASVVFSGPPLPAANAEPTTSSRARMRAEAAGIPIADPVDFWTEASLFSSAGYATFVCGPGDIAQAHTPDEWVELDELVLAATHYRKVMEGMRP